MVNSTKTQKKVFTTRLIWCIIKTKQNKTKKNKEKRENKSISLTLKLRKNYAKSEGEFIMTVLLPQMTVTSQSKLMTTLTMLHRQA